MRIHLVLVATYHVRTLRTALVPLKIASGFFKRSQVPNHKNQKIERGIAIQFMKAVGVPFKRVVSSYLDENYSLDSQPPSDEPSPSLVPGLYTVHKFGKHHLTMCGGGSSATSNGRTGRNE
jgi:hypothetical protein